MSLATLLMMALILLLIAAIPIRALGSRSGACLGLMALALSACGEMATLPISAGIGQQPAGQD